MRGPERLPAQVSPPAPLAHALAGPAPLPFPPPAAALPQAGAAASPRHASVAPHAGQPRRAAGAADHLFDSGALLLAEDGGAQMVDAPRLPGSPDTDVLSLFQFVQREVHGFSVRPKQVRDAALPDIHRGAL